MLPVNAQSSFLHLSLFYFQPSPSIPRRDRSLPPQCGEAARRIGNKGVHLPCLPTHRSHPDPHKGVMQVARSDSPWGARDVAAALKSHGAAPKSRRRMMPDPPPQPRAPVEAFGLLRADSRGLSVGPVAHRQECYSRNLRQVCQKRQEGKELSRWRAEETKEKPRTVKWMSIAEAELGRGLP